MVARASKRVYGRAYTAARRDRSRNFERSVFSPKEFFNHSNGRATQPSYLGPDVFFLQCTSNSLHAHPDGPGLHRVCSLRILPSFVLGEVCHQGSSTMTKSLRTLGCCQKPQNHRVQAQASETSGAVRSPANTR